MAEAAPSKGPWAARLVLATAALQVLTALVDPWLVEDPANPGPIIVAGLVFAVWLSLLIASAITFIVWEFRTIRAASLAADVDLTPSEAIVWWFVPLLNLWKPYQVVRTLTERLAPPLTGTVGRWWIAYVAMNLFGAMGSAGMGDAGAIGRWGSAGGAVVSAVLLARLIRGIQAGLDGLAGAHGR